MEFSRPEYWSGFPFPSPGDLPNPGLKPRSLALQADSLSTEPQGKSVSKYDKMFIVESGWWVYGYSWKNSFKFSACLEFFIIVYQGGGSKSINNLAGLYSGLKDMVFIRYIGVVGVLSVQFSSVTQSCPTLWPHELQHARPPCPSPTPGVYSNSCPSSQWCHPAISSSVVPFSSCPQIFPSIRVAESRTELSDWTELNVASNREGSGVGRFPVRLCPLNKEDLIWSNQQNWSWMSVFLEGT